MNYEVKELPQNARLVCTELVNNANHQCEIENSWNHNPYCHYVWHKEFYNNGKPFENGIRLSDMPDNSIARVYCIDSRE